MEYDSQEDEVVVDDGDAVASCYSVPYLFQFPLLFLCQAIPTSELGVEAVNESPFPVTELGFSIHTILDHGWNIVGLLAHDNTTHLFSGVL